MAPTSKRSWPMSCVALASELGTMPANRPSSSRPFRKTSARPSASATSRSCTRPRTFAESQGLDWNDLSVDRKLEIVEEASADGRLGKLKTDEKRIWHEQAEALGWRHTTAMNETVHEALSDRERFDRAYRFAARHLADEFRTAATITHEKLGMYAARGLIDVGVAGGPDDIRHVVELIEQRGIRIRGEQVALVTGIMDDMVRVTNTAQIRIEEKVTHVARAGRGTGRARCPPTQFEKRSSVLTFLSRPSSAEQSTRSGKADGSRC